MKVKQIEAKLLGERKTSAMILEVARKSSRLGGPMCTLHDLNNLSAFGTRKLLAEQTTALEKIL